MAEKNFLSWLGFKDEANSGSTSGSATSGSATQGSSTNGASATSVNSGNTSSARSSSAAGSTNSSTFERIRELEAELADLRARRDITSLTREEFEILATETATSLIKTAQAREARAVAAAERALGEAQRAAKALTESAELKARTALQSAEGRGRKYIEVAEQEAKEAIEKATRAAQELLDSKHREASTITSAAKREADRVISEATADIANFKNWLGEAIAESERLAKLQAQALAAAEEGIKHSRAKLSTAFERLASLGTVVESALDENHRPKEKEFASGTAPTTAKTSPEKASQVKRNSAAAKKPAAKKTSSTTRKSVGRSPKRK